MMKEPHCIALVVDDDPVIFELLSSILDGINVRVLTAKSGYEAIDVLEQQTVDVVLTEVELQGMAGFELLTHINETDESIEVIMITAHDSHAVVRRALRAKAYDYLNKPFTDHDDVRDTVSSALESVRLSRENNDQMQRLRADNTKLNAANKRLLQLNKQLRKLAITDSLTQLYNRRYVDDWLKNHAFTNTYSKSCYSIMLLDVDHFKSINDTLGHDSGDMVLRHLASIVQRANRDTDIVGRYGGEEFIVVMPETDVAGAVQMAERVRSAIEEASIEVNSGSVRITVSIGLATNRAALNNGSEFDLTPAEAYFSGRALVAQADKSLYAAKEQGRNRCIHHNHLPEPMDSQLPAA